MNIKGKKKYFYYLKKILISVFIFFLAIVTICTFITLFYSDKIKDYVVAQINKQLSTELYVEKIEFTALKKFPYISLVFNNLTIKDAINSKNKKDLLKAEKLYLQFNLWDFFKNNYKVKKIELSNATIRLIVFKNGSDNYHFLKTDTTDKENDFSFYLQKIILQNTNFYYVNFINGQNYSLQINRITLNGNFAQTNYSVIASGNSFVNHIKSGQIIYLHNKNLEFKISLDVNDHYYKFKKALLKIGEINFNVEGEFIDKIDNQYLNICIKGENLDLEDFSKELPSNYYSYIANYEAKGKFDLIACVKGYVANNNTPEVEILANLKNAKLKQKYTSVALNDINMNFKFSNGTRKSIESSFIEVNNFSGKLKTGNINGNFKIVNFKQPNITLNVNGALELNTVNDFIHIDTIETITGNIKGNIFFHGQLAKVANFTVKDYINSKVEGEIKVDNCTIKLKNSKQKYANISGDFVFNNNDVIAKDLKGNLIINESNIKNNDFIINGIFTNIIPYIFLKGQNLNVNADFYSNNIEIDKLLVVLNNQQNNTNTNNNPYNFQLPENLNLNLNIRIKDLSFNKFNAYMASGKIYLKNKQIIANEVKFNTMDGKVLISGLLDNNRDNKILLSCDATVYDINISKLFYQFNNFGQQNIKYNNINGTLNADIQFAAFCNNSFTIDANTIYVKSSVNIENGQLLNYKPIEGLSKYIKWKDLSNIKFYSLTNQIEVKNRNVYIPQMEIKSSALNLNLWGNHNFDNQIEYHINVSLSDLKKNTAKTTKKEEFGDIEDDGLNKFNYFFLITGTVDNPIYNIIDKQAYKEKIINDIKKEKESLKEILKNEFGLKKNDTLKLNKKEEFKKKQGNDFIYEWEEE